MGFMAQLREFGLDQLGIPCLAAKRHKLPSGKTRCYITETKTEWDPDNKRPRPAYSKSVGVVENNAEFGRIIFKDEFLERYPQVRDVTVIRKQGHQYVYVKKPFAQADAVGYHQPGVKRYSPPIPTGKVRHCGATLFTMLIADAYNLAKALAESAQRDSGAVFATANAGLQLRSGALHRIEPNIFNYWYGCDTFGMSSGALTQLCKRLVLHDVPTKYTKSLLKAHFVSDGVEFHFFAIDGTSLSGDIDNEFSDRGFNKEHDKSKQLNLMMLVDQSTGIPFYSRIITGNVNDVSAYQFDAKQIAKFLRSECHLADLKDNTLPMIHVFDRGFVGSKNFDVAVDLGFNFVCNMTSSLKAYKDARAYAIARQLGSGQHRLSDELEFYGVDYIAIPKEHCYTVTTASGAQARLCLHVFFDQTLYAERLIATHDISRSICSAHMDGSYDSLPSNWLKDDKKYNLVKKVKGADGRIHWVTDFNACHLAAKDDATWVLGTTLSKLSGIQVYKAYKNRIRVEQAINCFKQGGGRRVRTGNDSTMQGRIFIDFYRASLYQGMHNRISLALKGAFGRLPTPEEDSYLRSIPKLLDYLNGIGCYSDGKGGIIVTEITGTRRTLFEVLGFPIARKDEETIPLDELVSPSFAELYTYADAAEEGISIRRKK